MDETCRDCAGSRPDETRKTYFSFRSRFRLRTSRPKRAEGNDRAYVSRVFKLTRVSPVIVEQALAGKVTMEALMAMGGYWVLQKA